jgi:cyclic pyranopterin monophosphate synthase
MNDLTHFDQNGHAHMVDVSAKAETDRVAIARGTVVVSADTFLRIQSGQVEKGDVLAVARLAGIMGAKRTPDLIPLCHPLSLTSVKIELSLDPSCNAIIIEAICQTTGKTGVEMEAMTAVTVAALTIYDMVKAMDRTVCLTDIRLIHKSGGKSGQWDYTSGP